MNTLHPHWQSTDEDERPVRVKAVAHEAASRRIPRAKRTPAAVVGVAAFALLGLALFRGSDGLFGQLTRADTEIEITATGLYPEIATVRHGETIRWTNSSGIPHILRSDAIVLPDGKQFTTGAIFPGSEFTLVVPSTIPAGIYDYDSETSAEITGQIIVESSAATSSGIVTNATDSSASSSSISSIATTSSLASSMPSSIASSVMATVSSVPSSAAASMRPAAPSIPENPHTVGHAGAPLMPRQTTTATVTPVSSQPSVSKHVPVAQPTTGIEHWTLIVIGVLALAGVTWKVGRID